VKAYEAKLAEFVIPVEELGFDPLVPTNTDWLLFFLLTYNWYVCFYIVKYLWQTPVNLDFFNEFF
jgi:hypothetical protein